MAVWNDILGNVATQVEAVTGIPASVVVRKGGTLLDTDTIPIVIVCDGGAEELADTTFALDQQLVYPVKVIVVEANNREFAVGDTDLTFRQALRDKLNIRPPLPSVSSVIDVDLTPLSPFEIQGSQTVYRVTGFECRYTSWETRAS